MLNLSRSRSILLIALLCGSGSLHAAAPELGERAFRAGDRWLAVGDSITQNGSYYAWVYLYYVTRFPGQELEVANAGISGDLASRAVTRHDWDIAPRRATVATVMFGMNDVDRSLYGDLAITPGLLEKRKAAMDTYERNLTDLAGRIHRDGSRVVLVTPSIFDDTAEGERPRQTGVNAALGQCGAIMSRIAANNGYSLIDLHTPMTQVSHRLQASDPKASVIGPDRIHPGVAGHLLMAYHILKAQAVPALVSEVYINAAEVRSDTTRNADVTNLRASATSVDFEVKERALPYPVLGDMKPAFDWVPFHDDLNRQILRVTGLSPGDYRLSIDGAEIRVCTAAELAAGVNLALEDTPQMRQSVAVGEMVRRWQQVTAQGLRVLAQVEYWQLRDVPKPVAIDAVRDRLEAMLARFKSSSNGMDQYNRGVVERYLKAKPEEEKTKAEVAELVKRIRAEAQPRPHVYRIAPVSR